MNAAHDNGWMTNTKTTLFRILHPLTGSGRVPMAVVMLVVVFLGVFAWAWGKWGRNVTQNEQYRITEEDFQIPDPPPWIHANVREEVVRDSSLAQVSLLDPEVTRRVREAFELHTWVSKVHFVSKRSGKLLVNLSYRKPIIMIETNGGWWPVDTEGVLLPPTEFSLAQTKNYLHVRTRNHRPSSPVVGTAFGDPGVEGAARLAQALDAHWRRWGVQRIHVVESDNPNQADIFYELETTAGSRVRWGRAPGQERPGEQTAAEKVRRLDLHFDEQGTLDSISRGTIDVRFGLKHSAPRYEGRAASFERPASSRQ